MSVNIVELIQDYKCPSTPKDIKSLFSFINFYLQFIQNFSIVFKLITDLTKKEFQRTKFS
jgi:hypothetical protein